MRNKFFNIFFIVLLIIISFIFGLYFSKNLFIKGDNKVDVYDKLDINFDVRDAFVDDNTIILDDDAYENIIITSNKNYNLRLYSINPDAADFTKDKLLKEVFVTNNIINIKTFMGEVMPSIYIEIVTEDEVLEVVPLYNGRDGGYKFHRVNK